MGRCRAVRRRQLPSPTSFRLPGRVHYKGAPGPGGALGAWCLRGREGYIIRGCPGPGAPSELVLKRPGRVHYKDPPWARGRPRSCYLRGRCRHLQVGMHQHQQQERTSRHQGWATPAQGQASRDLYARERGSLAGQRPREARRRTAQPKCRQTLSFAKHNPQPTIQLIQKLARMPRPRS